jgi:hypothetical protein
MSRMFTFDLVGFLPTFTGHMKRHNLGQTVTSVCGYRASVLISHEDCLHGSNLDALHRWAASLATISSITAMDHGGDIHVEVEGTLPGGTNLEVRTYLRGVHADAVRRHGLSPFGQTKLPLPALAAIVSESLLAVA